ncbi:FHA domain-containing protein [Agromyces silvae]|uniref:FHA domain-containing protein n=1 Tax=Agromyces silvae TaxID=3388266 RepID=UPI00280B1FEF|nr:hypothetical protein [Agromyces protaetiae]
MASARCVYCDATLQPNSMYCVECGQLIPQQPLRPPVPAQFARPREQAAAPRTDAPPAARPASVEPVPLPRTLPWQQQAAREAAPAPVATQTAAPIERVELAFSTGQRVVVTGAAVIGRKPADTALAMGVRAVEVEDDTRSVSRVHLFLEVADGVVLIGDAGSANGSRLERGGAVTPLEAAGTRVPAAVGDTVWLGDLSFELRSA